MMNNNEENIIREVINGNRNAFSYIVDIYKDMVFNIIINIIHNQEEAEDVSQDVFLKVYYNIKNYKFKSKFSTWLFSIAYNEAISHTRKQTFNYIIEEYNNIDNSYEDNFYDEDNEMTYSEMLLKVLLEEVEKLNDLDKTIITLFYQLNTPIKEIATITNLTENNVKVKLHRIKKHLTKQLSNYGK